MYKCVCVRERERREREREREGGRERESVLERERERETCHNNVFTRQTLTDRCQSFVTQYLRKRKKKKENGKQDKRKVKIEERCKKSKYFFPK